MERYGRFARHEHDRSHSAIGNDQHGRWLRWILQGVAPAYLEQMDVENSHYHVEVTNPEADVEYLKAISVIPGVWRLNLRQGSFGSESLPTILKWSALQELSICADRLTEEDFAHLGTIRTLSTLRLHGEQPLDVGWLRHIADLDNLSTLDLTSIPLTGDWQIQPGDLPGLTWLDLWLAEKSAREAETPDGFNNLPGQTIRRPRVQDPNLHGLSALGSLTHVSLSGPGVNDAVVCQLSGSRSLHSLDLRGTQVGDGITKALRCLPALNDLDVSGTAVGDAMLQELGVLGRAGQLRHLWFLNVSATRVTGASMQSLESIPLVRLNVARCAAISAGIEPISRITRLESLCLAGTDISAEDIGQLTGLPNLRTLNPSWTNVGDAGLRRCTYLPSLRHLVMIGVPVTDDAVEAMYAQLNHSSGYTDIRLGNNPGLSADRIVELSARYPGNPRWQFSSP